MFRSREALVIEPLRPGDVETLQLVFDGLSMRSRFQRFHAGVPTLSPSMKRRLTVVEPGRQWASVARLKGRPVGLARWCRLGGQPRRADFAIEVIDAVHGRGVGSALTRAAARSAQASGIDTFVVDVCADNYVPRAWLSGQGIHAQPDDHTRFLVPVELLADAPVRLTRDVVPPAAGLRAVR